MLGFSLLPRLKRIGAQRLYRSDAGTSGPLACSLTSAVPAHRLGPDRPPVGPDDALRHRPQTGHRRHRGHPTYRALAELGRAVKTVFLCEYLSSEQLRREVHEGLNVIENWNSANGLIYFGKGGEIASNPSRGPRARRPLPPPAPGVPGLHQHLDDPADPRRPTKRGLTVHGDLCGFTALTYSHVNPYGIRDAIAFT
jgi:hypothetical protein